MPYDSAEERRRRAKVAQSHASATPIQPAAPMQAPQMANRGPSPLAQAGIGIGKKLLGSALGPLGGVLGGLFNQGGSVVDDKEKLKKIREQQKARMAAQRAQQAAQANQGTKRIAPQQRVLFDKNMNRIGQIQGDVIKGYAQRPTQDQAVGKAQLVDPFEGIAAKIQAAKAAGKPVDYNALAALQHARSTQNEAERMKKLRQFMDMYPGFALPGGSQGAVWREKNMGGPISMKYGYNKGGRVPWWRRMLDRNPERNAQRRAQRKNLGGMINEMPRYNKGGPLNPMGYNEGGPAMPTPIKKVMDEDKITMAREAFEMAEARKDQKAMADERRAQEKHDMDMKLKKAQMMTRKAPLAKK